MLGQKPRLLNLDNSLTRQRLFLEKFPPFIVELSSLGPSLRQWAGKSALESFRAKLDPQLKNSPTFFGSGDFHHLSSILISQFSQPLSVIVFDQHPDWDAWSFRYACGSWVNSVVSLPNVKKVILMAQSGSDLSTQSLFSAGLSGLNRGKLEIYPYQSRPVRVYLRRIGDSPCLKVRRGFGNSLVEWQDLPQDAPGAFLARILPGLPTEEVYISIDKDCLKRRYALTNWEEGRLELEWLLEALRIIRAKKELAGLDVTGDYSPPVFQGWFRNLVAHSDHPPQPPETRDPLLVNSVNESTNISILETLYT